MIGNVKIDLIVLIIFALTVDFGDGIPIGYRMLAIYYFDFYIRIDV